MLNGPFQASWRRDMTGQHWLRSVELQLREAHILSLHLRRKRLSFLSGQISAVTRLEKWSRPSTGIYQVVEEFSHVVRSYSEHSIIWTMLNLAMKCNMYVISDCFLSSWMASSSTRSFPWHQWTKHSQLSLRCTTQGSFFCSSIHPVSDRALSGLHING